MLPAVQPRLRPWVLTLTPVDQGRFCSALLQPDCAEQDLSDDPALPQSSSCASAELPDEHVWSCCVIKSSEGEEKYTRTDQYNSERTTENTHFLHKLIPSQPQMGGWLVRVKSHSIACIFNASIKPSWPAKLHGHTLILPNTFSWLPREALKQRHA